MSRRARISRKRNNTINKNIGKSTIIAVIIAVCLFVIYRFNFFSKSEFLYRTTVNFKEYNSDKLILDDLDILEDEEGKYILLPEKVSGYYVTEYYYKDVAVLPEVSDTENQTTDNTVSNEAQTDNTIDNTDTNTSNTIDNTNTIEENDNTNTIVENNSAQNESTNTAKNTEITNTVDNTNTVNSDDNSSSTETNNEEANTVAENKVSDEETIDDENTNNDEETAESLFDKAIAAQDDEGNDNKNEINEENDVIDENKTEEQETNESDEKTDETDIEAEVTENEEKEALEENEENKKVDEDEAEETEEPKKTYFAGDKLYISDEDIKNKSLEIEVKLETTEVKGETLYKQELEAFDESATIKVDGFIPYDYKLEIKKEDNEKIEELKEGVEGLAPSSIILAYDIKIVKDENEYQPKDYYQNVNVTIVSETEFTDNLLGNSVEMLHIIEDKENDEMIFERIALSNKTEDTVECIANEFSTYAIAVADNYTAEYARAYNYDNDYNYYIGKNFTDSISGDNSGTYTDENLAEVTVNYYSYDYSKNPSAPADLTVNTVGWNSTSSTSGNGNGPDVYYNVDLDENFNDIYTFYDRIYHVTVTVTAPNGKYFDVNRPWSFSFNTYEGIMLENLQGLNNNMFSATPTYTGGKLNLSGSNFQRWTRDSLTTFHITFNLRYNLGRNVYTPATINMNTVTGATFTAKEKILMGYIGPTGEKQTLFTYVQCLPMDSNGYVNVELIDNPFMDRPTDGGYAGWGFDGWKSNETYSISTDTNTYVQSLSASTTNKSVTINLYPDWKLANYIFVDGRNNYGNDADDGSYDNPVRTWGSNNNNGSGIKKCLMSSNYKTATNASSRELNIIVVRAGTLTNINTQTNRAYTITSLYNGTDYRSTTNPGVLDVTSAVTLSNDLQLDFVNITGPGHMNDALTTAAEGGWGAAYSRGNNPYKNGLTNLGTYIIGNCHNLRIGRGMMPSAATATNDRTTFTQVQGGYGGNSGIYKLVVETGKYVNIQVGTAYNSTNYSANAIGVFGNDYDRIKDPTNQGQANFIVASKIASRTYTEIIHKVSDSRPLFLMTVKSGNIGNPVYNLDDEEYTPYAGIYVGGHGYSNNYDTTEDKGDRILYVEGGNIANIVGGLKSLSGTTVKTNIYVKGGTITNIVGGAGRSTCYGDRIIQITDGTVRYSVSGGSNGFTSEATGSNNGLLEGNTLVYVGGNAVIGTTDAAPRNSLYYVEDGCVLGAGNGNQNAASAGKVDSSHIIIDGNANVKNNVYGGGNFGVVGPRSSSTSYDFDVVSFDNVSSTNIANGSYIIANGTGNGSRALNANGTATNLKTLSTREFPAATTYFTFERTGNQYYIYQGNNYLTQSMQLDPYTLRTFTLVSSGTGVKIYTRYRNQNRYLRNNNGTITYTTNANDSGTVWYLLNVNELPLPSGFTEPSETKVEILGGRVGNDVYGGSNQNNINGSVDVEMKGGTVVGAVYGGSNTKGTITKNTTINVSGGTIGTQGTINDRLFGGGKGQQTIVTGMTNVNVTDADSNVKIYGNIYGGSALGTVNGNATVKIEDKTSDTNTITLSGNVYGGGKGQTGANGAAINGGDTTVIVDGGTYNSLKVFGGSNVNGTIAGDVLVKIGETAATTVNEVYGGGNQANVTNITESVKVYLYQNATVTKAFNGGNSAGIVGDDDTTEKAIYVPPFISTIVSSTLADLPPPNTSCVIVLPVISTFVVPSTAPSFPPPNTSSVTEEFVIVTNVSFVTWPWFPPPNT